MKKPLAVLSLIVSATLVCSASEWKAGLFSSPEGFGLCCDLPGIERVFHSFSANLDCYDRMFGDEGKLGFTLNYSQNRYLTKHLYAGPGISAGYVRDNDDSNPGPMAAITCTFGAHFVSGRGIAVDISLHAALGLRLNTSDGSGPTTELYRRGLTHIPFPRLMITFPIR